MLNTDYWQRTTDNGQPTTDEDQRTLQMFIIAGVSPKTKILDHTPRICPACGLAQARLKRVDSYFNLFFIPILRVKKGEPFIICDRCESVTAETPPGYQPPSPGPDSRCGNCGRPLDEEFKYCPSCGQPL